MQILKSPFITVLQTFPNVIYFYNPIRGTIQIRMETVLILKQITILFFLQTLQRYIEISNFTLKTVKINIYYEEGKDK